MTLDMLLAYLEANRIIVHVTGDRVRCEAARGLLTPDVVTALKTHKSALIRRFGPGETTAPLAFSQRHLWLLDQIEPGNPFYNNPLAVRLTGELDRDALRQSLDSLTARHGILRARFTAENGSPRQIIPVWGPADLPLTDLSSLPPSEAEAEALKLARTEAATPFNLRQSPMIRSRLIRIAPEDHLWLLTVHHIVADGWSIGILLREVQALYRQHHSGTPATLPPPAQQFTDFARQQTEGLPSAALQTQLTYWTGQLADAPPLLTLPTLAGRPPVQTYRGDHCSLTLPPATGAAVRALGRHLGVTGFTLVMCAFALALARFSGMKDFCIGTPLANRDDPGIEDLIGHFINTVALRLDLTGCRTAKDLIGLTQSRILEALTHQDVPFEQVVEAVNPPRDTSHAPLFQVMLIYQNMPMGGFDFPGLTATAQEISSRTAKFDLTLEVFDTPEGLRFGLEYNCDLFSEAMMMRLARATGEALRQFCDDQNRPLAAIDILTDGAGTPVLKGADIPVDPALTAHALIEAAADADPALIAVTDEDEALTYAELDLRANRLANHLITRGIGRGSRVALCAERSATMVIALLAILKTGAAYVPLDPDYPVQRLTFMLTDSRPLCLLHHLPRHPEVAAALIPLAAQAADADAARPDDPATRPAIHGLTGEDPAYILYTSGSTGQPKGAVIPHRALVNLTRWSCRTFGLGPGDALLQKTPFSFDASVWEFFWPLASGAQLVMMPPGRHGDPACLCRSIIDNSITTVQFVPALLEAFLDEPQAGDCRSLRDIFCGGGPLTAALINRLRDRLPDVRLHNVYGPTEAAVDTLCWTAPAGYWPEGQPVPLGLPIDNAAVRLTDEDGLPVPAGTPGEIRISGTGVGHGYFGRPDLSAAAFIPDGKTGGPEYRTGDLARMLPDGTLTFIGRRDHQVKLRGFRIELGEIEAGLATHSAIAEAVVLADPDRQRLRAFCRLSPGQDDPGETTLRDHLLARLPDYMVPDRVTCLPRFPLSPGGKTDRAALASVPESPGDAVNQTTPRDDIELTLYRIWKDLLLHPRIGLRDNFFSIGGSSIAAIRLAHAAGEAFGLTIPVREIIRHPTIEDLGGWIRTGAAHPGRDSSLITFRPGTGNGTVVCVHPAGGTGFCYLSLARELPETVGIVALQSPGLNEGEDLLPGIPAMAAAYLDLIGPLTGQPLILTGLSFGGHVAYEMARLLTQRGKQDVCTILLDTQGTDDPDLRRSTLPVDLPEFRRKLVRFNGMYPGITDAQIERYFHVYNHNRLSVRDYDVPPQRGRLVFIQAKGQMRRAELRPMRDFWRRRAQGGYLTRLVAGDHWEMLETRELLKVSRAIRLELARLCTPAAEQRPMAELEAL